MTGAIALSSTTFAQDQAFWSARAATAGTNQDDYLPDVKGVSTAIIDPSTDYAVHTGTMFRINDHVTYYDGYQMPIFFKTNTQAIMELFSGGASSYLPEYLFDERFINVRSVDIELDQTDADVSYITAWERPWNNAYITYTTDAGGSTFPTNPASPALYNDRDGVKILKMDNVTGAILDEINVFDNTPLDASQDYGHSLIPTRSMYHDGYLYVCGFYTPDDTRCPDCQSFYPPAPLPVKDIMFSTTEKKAFVAKIDCSGGGFSFVDMKYYDTYSPSSVPNNAGVDFDMALGMKMLNDGRLMVTGSVNAIDNNLTGYIRSGTMAYVLDPATLNIVAEQHFIAPDNGDGIGDHEYGVDITEVYNPAVSTVLYRAFIVGNQYDYFNTENEDPETGYSQKPKHLYIGGIVHDNSGSYGLIGSRCMTTTSSSFWATNFLKNDALTLGGGNDYRFLVAGMMTTAPAGYNVLTPSMPISNTNINPFLLEFQTQSILSQVAPLPKPQLTVFESKQGTNNYDILGGANSNIFFHPYIGDRTGANSNIVLSAPWYYSDPYFPGLMGKMEIVKETATTHVYSHGDCGINNYDGVGFTNGSSVSTILTANSAEQASYSPDAVGTVVVTLIGGSSEMCNNLSSNPYAYKPTGVENIANSNEFKLYPNPATSEVHVSLANSVSKDAKVSVVLMNMYGQSVGSLYSGKASNLNANTTLQLPDVATGIYMVQIIVDGQLAHTEKLVIE